MQMENVSTIYMVIFWKITMDNDTMENAKVNLEWNSFSVVISQKMTI